MHNKIPNRFLKTHKPDIEAEEIAKRAKFWQEYLQTYPNSPFLHDAQFLKNAYSSLLFLGTEEAPISTSFENQTDIDAASWLVIERLAKSNDGELSAQAKKFVHFLAMSKDQRQQKFKLVKKNALNWKISLNYWRCPSSINI